MWMKEITAPDANSANSATRDDVSSLFVIM
jgi:hypothetical protein